MLTIRSVALMHYDLLSIFKQGTSTYTYTLWRAYSRSPDKIFSRGVWRWQKVPAELEHCHLMINVYKWIPKYIRGLIRRLASSLASDRL